MSDKLNKIEYSGRTVRKRVKVQEKDEYGNDIVVVRYVDVPLEEHLKGLPKADLYDLKSQIDAGINLREVNNFSMDANDPIVVEQNNLRQATIAVTELSAEEQKQVQLSTEPINNDNPVNEPTNE